MSYVGLWLQISRKLGVNCIFGKVTSTTLKLFFCLVSLLFRIVLFFRDQDGHVFQLKPGTLYSF